MLFPVVGCTASGSSSATRTCHSGDVTFSIGTSSIVCCPSAWSTSAFGDLYCYTSIAASTTSAGVSARNLEGTTTGTVTNTVDMWGLTGGKTAAVTNAVFVRAASGNATSGACKSARVALNAETIWALTVGLGLGLRLF
jgi:hypothetical protein